MSTTTRPRAPRMAPPVNGARPSTPPPFEADDAILVRDADFDATRRLTVDVRSVTVDCPIATGAGADNVHITLEDCIPGDDYDGYPVPLHLHVCTNDDDGLVLHTDAASLERVYRALGAAIERARERGILSR